MRSNNRRGIRIGTMILAALLISSSMASCNMQGAQGPQGVQGIQGEKGDKGDTGAQGEKGDTGAQGEKGDKGDTGAQGEKGDKGDTGAQGEKGDKGDTGAQGEKGDTGAQGEKGDKGDTGAQGEKGDKGDTGAQGEKGDKGDTGAQGEKGDKGDTGAQGDKGDTGSSAYELYKEKYGYEGTEEEWLYDLVNGNLAMRDTHTVSFDLNGGTGEISSQSVIDGGKAEKPVTPVRNGYTFEGWSYEGETWSFIGYTVTADMVLTARWAPITYTITYDLKGGLETELPTAYTVEDSIILPKLTHGIAGYVFEGWLRDGDTTPTLDTVIPQGTMGDLTFTAVWTVISLGQAVDNGTVVKPFSPNTQLWNPTTNDYRIHVGVDLTSSVSSAVYAMYDGIITAIHEDLLLGLTVTVSGKGGVLIKYQNLDSVVSELEVGQKIARGDAIGIYGGSSMMEMVDEPHLHVEMFINGERVDPMRYIG